MGYKVSDTYTGGGDLLKPAHLKDQAGGYRSVPVTVESVTVASMPKERGSSETETKFHLHFVGKDKELRLNRTNAQSMAMWFGDDTDAWLGQQIVLGVHQTNMGPGITIINPAVLQGLGQQRAPSPPPPTPQEAQWEPRPSQPFPPNPIIPTPHDDDDFDDDIPF